MSLLLITLYVLFLHYILWVSLLWNPSFIKDSIFWYFGVAITLFVNVNKVSDKSFFINILYDNLKILVLIEFIVNFYTFSFIVEMILVPFILFITVLNVGNKVTYKNLILDKLTNFFFISFALIQLFFIVYKIALEYKSLVNYESLNAFILYPVLTIMYLPFIYLFAIYLKYDTIFIVVSRGLKERSLLIKAAKKKIFFTCGLNLRKINIFHRTSVYKFFEAQNLNDVNGIVFYFKNFWKKYKVRYKSC